jgi:repressor LexA
MSGVDSERGGERVAALPRRRAAVLAFIARYQRERGFPPTVREIAKGAGLSSPATVHAHLAALEREGWLRRDPSKPRAIELLPRAREATAAAVTDAPRKTAPATAVAGASGARRLPLVGRVAAGTPLLAEEHWEGLVSVPAQAGGDRGDFVLAVRGDSMRDAGILDGDWVVVRRQETADNGDVVVALVGGEEATVKRFFHDGDAVRLEPANPRYEPIRTRDARIVGRVVGVLRRLP